MARKKISPIETLGSDVDNLTVQKSRPLFALWRSELTLPEFKILESTVTILIGAQLHLVRAN